MYTVKKYDFLPDEASKIRLKVFNEEQGFKQEFDDTDSLSVHFVAFDSKKAIGTARMFTHDNWESCHIGRVAVLKQYRGKHIGRLIMLEALKEAKMRGAKKAVVSSQQRVEGFYKSLGFSSVGEVYYDEWCPHIKMTKELS